MSLALKCDEAVPQRRSVTFDIRIESIHHSPADPRLRVLQHRVAVDEVQDEGITEHNDLGAHPLIAIVRCRCGVDKAVRIYVPYFQQRETAH